MSLPFFFLALIAVSHMLLLPDLMAVLCCCFSKLLFSKSRWKKKKDEGSVFANPHILVSCRSD